MHYLTAAEVELESLRIEREYWEQEVLKPLLKKLSVFLTVPIFDPVIVDWEEPAPKTATCYSCYGEGCMGCQGKGYSLK